MPDDVTIFIKTFERPAALTRLLNSIEDRYPECSTLIPDDSLRELRIGPHVHESLPPASFPA